MPSSILATIVAEVRQRFPEGFAFLSQRLKMLEQALLVEQAVSHLALVLTGNETEDSASIPRDDLVEQTAVVTARLSNELTRLGPIKRILLPRDQNLAESVREGMLIR